MLNKRYIYVSAGALMILLGACNNDSGGGTGDPRSPNPPKDPKQLYERTNVRETQKKTTNSSGQPVLVRTIKVESGDTLVLTSGPSSTAGSFYTSAVVNGSNATTGKDFAEGYVANKYTNASNMDGIGYVAYIGKNGPTVIWNGTNPDMLRAMTKAGYVQAKESGMTSFTGINYQYVSTTNGTSWNSMTGADGKITVDPSAAKGWSATLGAVNLNGNYDGKNVSGRSSLNGLNGVFEGVDAYNPTTKDYQRGGVFASAPEGGINAYAGVWGNAVLAPKSQ